MRGTSIILLHPEMPVPRPAPISIFNIVAIAGNGTLNGEQVTSFANILLIAICILLPAGYFQALRSKWFSRLEGGLRIAVIAAVAGFALLGAVLAGTFSYRSGRRIVMQEILNGLSGTGDVIQANLRHMIDYEVEQLHEYADFLMPDMAPNRSAQLAAQLLSMDQLNKEILEVSVYDMNQKRIATSHVQGENGRESRVAVATALDGEDYVSDAVLSPATKGYELLVATPIRDAKQQVIGALSIHYDLQTELSRIIQAARFGGDGRAQVLNSAGRVVAHVDPKRVDADMSKSKAFQLTRTEAGGDYVVENDYLGKSWLWVARPMKSPASGTTLPWALVVQMDEAKAVAPIGELRNQVLLALAIVSVCAVFVGWRVGLSISQPIDKLASFVKRVQGGDFTGSVDEGQNEIGLLGKALNQMTRGLEERDRVKELFGRYVATQVSDKIVKGEVPVGGESRHVSILFSDIRGFTTMSEAMPPTQVVSFLNDYFSEMVEAVFEQGGVLDKFMGDGLMAVFGSMSDMPDHPRRAVLTALRMKSLLGKINGNRAMHGEPPISIGIGVHTADVIVGNIGSRRRLEYTVIGDGVNTCSRVQALNKEFGTTILITETTWEMVKDQFDCRVMPETELRGKTRAMRFFEVVSVKAGVTAA
jgi:adenylate cyclase